MLNTYSFLVCDNCEYHISHIHNIERVDNDENQCPSCRVGKFKIVVEEVKPCPRCGENGSFADAISSKTVYCSCGINIVEHGYQYDMGRSLIHKWNERSYKYNDSRFRTIITVFYEDIPKTYKDIPFDKLTYNHIGVPIDDIRKAEVVRVIKYNDHSENSVKYLKDRFL